MQSPAQCCHMKSITQKWMKVLGQRASLHFLKTGIDVTIQQHHNTEINDADSICKSRRNWSEGTFGLPGTDLGHWDSGTLRMPSAI